MQLSDVIAAINSSAPATEAETRKRNRSSVSSLQSVAPLSKILHWDGAPQRTRVMSTRSNRPESVAEGEEPASIVAGDDVFEPGEESAVFSPEAPHSTAPITPASLANTPAADTISAHPVHAGTSTPATRTLPQRAARPTFFYDPSIAESSQAPGSAPSDAPNSDAEPPRRPDAEPPRRPVAEPPRRPNPPHVLPSAAFNASNIRTHVSRHYGNQQNNPASGRRHATSGGPEMFIDSVSLIEFSGFSSRPRNVAYTPVNQRLWIRRCTRPSELILKNTNVSQGLIQSLRDIVAQCPTINHRLEGPQPDMEILRQSLEEFHSDQLCKLPVDLEALFQGLNLLDGGNNDKFWSFLFLIY